jgi:PTH1 family peptidyl-tRNA hydrolase
LSGSFLIIGLGNPGPKYAETRHNAGFWFLDALLGQAGGALRERSKLSADLARVDLHGRHCLLARPTTFMNRSGQAVRAVMDYYGITAGDMLVAYDELDLPPGTVRLKQDGGHGGHNGLRDIFRHVADTGFLRLRIGIGHPGHKDAVTKYVLGRSPAQIRGVVESTIERAAAVMPLVLDGRVQEAMTALHTEGKS